MAKNRFKQMTDQQLRAEAARLKRQGGKRPGQARVVSATEKALRAVINKRKNSGTWTGGKTTGKIGGNPVPKENRRERKVINRSPGLGQTGPRPGSGGSQTNTGDGVDVPGSDVDAGEGAAPTAPGVPTGFDPYANAQVSEFIKNLQAPNFFDPTQYPGNPGGIYGGFGGGQGGSTPPPGPVDEDGNPIITQQSQGANLNQMQGLGMAQNLKQIPSLGQPINPMDPSREKKGLIPTTNTGNIQQPQIGIPPGDPNKKMFSDPQGGGGGTVGIEPWLSGGGSARGQWGLIRSKAP